MTFDAIKQLFPYFTDKEIQETLSYTDGVERILEDISDDSDNWKTTISGYGTSLERVNHPSHYTWLKDKCGIEVIDITRHMSFCLGNAIKYILRAGHKSEHGYSNKKKTIEDLQKAIWYIQDEINNNKQ